MFKKTVRIMMMVMIVISCSNLFAKDSHTKYCKTKDAIFNVRPVLCVCKYTKELSGMVLDRINYKIPRLWTLGDSGTGAKISCTNLIARLTKSITLDNAHNYDWEAMAQSSNGNLFICDIGDNKKKRSIITIYEVDPKKINKLTLTVSPIRVFEIKWEYRKISDPRFNTVSLVRAKRERDCEAVFILNKKLYLIEKSIIAPPRISSINISPNAPQRQTSKDEGYLYRVTDTDWITPLTDAGVDTLGNIYIMDYFSTHKIQKASWDNIITSKRKWRGKGGASTQARYPFRIKGGQAEAMAIIEKDSYLVGREDGKIFQWRNGEYVEKINLGKADN